MSRNLIYGFLVALVVAVGARSVGVVRQKPQEIRSHDFGSVIGGSGTRLTHRFKIHNNEPRAVEVLRVSKSCGCTEATVTSHTIEPAGFIWLDVKIALSGLEKSDKTSVSITTNGKDEPVRTYSVSYANLPLAELSNSYFTIARSDFQDSGTCRKKIQVIGYYNETTNQYHGENLSTTLNNDWLSVQNLGESVHEPRGDGITKVVKEAMLCLDQKSYEANQGRVLSVPLKFGDQLVRHITVEFLESSGITVLPKTLGRVWQ